MHWGIRWNVVQRILIDAPSYADAGKDEKKKEIRLTKENASEVARMINSLNR